MLALRSLVRECFIILLGKNARPHKIRTGLAAGSRLCVSAAKNLGYISGISDRPLQRAIRQYVSRGDTVYDIGANIGYVSLMFAKQVGTEGVVFAFEPIPQTFVLLQKNVALNDTDSIKALSVAAAANSGRTLMRSTDNPSMSSMIWHQGDPAAVEVSVRTAAIDDLVDAGELSLPKL